jgi:hypothetical protein
MKPTIPAAIVLVAVTTEAVLDHEHAKPHVETAAVLQVVTAPVPGPPPAIGIEINQVHSADMWVEAPTPRA